MMDTGHDRMVLETVRAWLHIAELSLTTMPLPSCAGERIIHRQNHDSHSDVLREYKLRIAKVLQQGSAGGRVVK